MPRTLSADVARAIDAVLPRAFGHVFFVACGGSLSVMMAGKYLLDRHSAALSSDALNADEFVARHPRRLGPRAIVILCSQTGTTRETLGAAKFAKSQGALTIGMTLDVASPLGTAVDVPVAYQAHYTTGIAIDAADSNYVVLYTLLAGILKRSDGVDLLSPLLECVGNLQPTIDRALVSLAPTLDPYAARFKDASAIYTLASGPVYGAAYSFSTCVLMEMQWYDSQAIHANEFFHGPFEIVDKQSRFIVIVGLDETRALAIRARDFLLRYGSPDNVLVLDAKEIDFSGLNNQIVPYLAPLVFFDALWKFAYRLAKLRGHEMLEGRRYMKKLSDY